MNPLGENPVLAHTDGKHGWVSLDLGDAELNSDGVFLSSDESLALFYSLGLSIIGMGLDCDDGPRMEAFHAKQRKIALFLLDSVCMDCLDDAHELQGYAPSNARQVFESLAESAKPYA